METLIKENNGLLRILCLAPSNKLGQYAGLQSVSWRDTTSRARVITASYGTEEALKEIQRADLAFLDCSTEGLMDARDVIIKGRIPIDRRALVVYLQDRQDWMLGETLISSTDLESKLKDWLRAEMLARTLGPPSVTWIPGELELDLLRPSIEWCVDYVLELYFPNQLGPAYIHYVGGGQSGTPLVRVEFKGDEEQYYLKFFEQADDFKTEWKGHQSALEWLGNFTVKLKPVPDLQEDAESQWMALSRLNAQLAALAAAPRNQVYPVCYRSARASKTLKVHYQAAAARSAFPKDAYKEVVNLLKARNSPSTRPSEMLFKCQDYGPPASSTSNRRTILETLKSSEYRAFIKSASQDLRRLEGACKETVNCAAGRLLLNDLLTGTLPGGITEQYSLVCGHIHGDANSRNFLFLKNVAAVPSGLQVIDCGCHATDAPLLLDPAQLESDLKVNLMASEEASGYEEIDIAQLPKWIKMEKQSLDTPFAFKIPAGLPDSVKRTYEIVQIIRGLVQEISSNGSDGQPDPRPYFFFLLYWTLRKLRHQTIPPTKRLYAMASVFLLLERLQ